ncbi:MAG: hypothetical protein OEM52_00200 [bacterium]|nr:hypothetical protein [bacterium]
MITQSQMEAWLIKNGFQQNDKGDFVLKNTKYRLFSDRYVKQQRDAAKKWYILDVTTYVDLFLEETDELHKKWHYVLGKKLSDVPQQF